jgi:excinuclease UvrABC helicase subunit UvrB
MSTNLSQNKKQASNSKVAIKKTINTDELPKRYVPVVEVVIRPTGLLDPKIIIKPTENQVDDVLEEVRKRVTNNQRVLITTMTKKFAEELDTYFKQLNIQSAYIHSDVETLERLDILADLRRGKYDVLIGINLLREGLDLPEVSLVAIFDADKEGFLRSSTSLIQIIGRAARHSEGQVIMYANKLTKSMEIAIKETNYRRSIQEEYNKKHNITPQSVSRDLETISDDVRNENQNVDIQKTEAKKGQNDSEFTIDSAFGRGKREINRRNLSGNRNSKSQLFGSFEEKKDTYTKELSEKKQSVDQLKEDLQIAIDAYDFEKAAAIRDLLQKI